MNLERIPAGTASSVAGGWALKQDHMTINEPRIGG